MLNKFDFRNPRTQYFTGLLFHLFFLILLYSFDISTKNMQVPTGPFSHNIFECSDVRTYTNPAMNFIANGVFGNGQVPDNFRTIGYPALIATFYYLFGSYWLPFFQVFQAILFAFLYPVISGTIQLVMDDPEKRLSKSVFLFLLISGAYFTRVPVLLTDTLFILLFASGFYFGLKTYKEKKTIFLMLYLIMMTADALVRPTLTLLPVLNLAMAYFCALKWKDSVSKTLRKGAVISLVLFLLINLSTLRNYLNYKFLSPSNVTGLTAFGYLAKKVLILEGRAGEYAVLKDKIDAVSDVSTQTNMQKEVMFRTVRQYPFSTLKVLFTNASNIVFTNNLVSNISNFFGYEWKTFKNSCYAYKKSVALSVANYLLMAFYFILWMMFGLECIHLLQQKNFAVLLLIALLFGMFMVPGILVGDGGSRFRLPFEHVLTIFGFSYFNRQWRRKVAA